MNIQDINNKNDGEWINEFKGLVSSSKNQQAGNGTVSKCILTDDTGSVHVETWDHDLHRYEGKTISFKGKGAVMKEYNGNKFIKLLKVAKLTAVEGGDQKLPFDGPPKPVASGESFEDAFFRRVTTGYALANDIEANSDGAIVLSGEDKRAIAISFAIAAERAGK